VEFIKKSMKRILLIGKFGQLATEIIKHSVYFDFDVVSFSKEELDVSDIIQVEKKIIEIKPDILINTSAYHVVTNCEENPAVAMEINFIAVRNLAKICLDQNITFVTYSTDYVFDGKKKVPYEENDRTNPLQTYGFSKLAGEYAALKTHPDKTFVIRTSGVYGGKNGSHEKKGNFVLNIIKELQDKNIIEVSSEQFVSPTYAVDLSISTLKLLNSNAEAGIYHLVNEGLCSWYEFAQEIIKLSKINKKIKPVDRGGLTKKMKRPKFSALKNSKAKSLGIELPPWQEGLKKYLYDLSNL